VVGGGPVYMTGRVEIESLERNFRCSSSEDQGNGTISSFNSKRLGQWNASCEEMRSDLEW
jgi:hypothetical protein